MEKTRSFDYGSYRQLAAWSPIQVLVLQVNKKNEHKPYSITRKTMFFILMKKRWHYVVGTLEMLKGKSYWHLVIMGLLSVLFTRRLLLILFLVAMIIGLDSGVKEVQMEYWLAVITKVDSSFFCFIFWVFKNKCI